MTQTRPSAAAALETLHAVFGYSSFRPLQAEIVDAILHRRDVFVLMPTGGGKSLCYQLPALVLDGLTVVVSPLIALMKDQVDNLQALGVAATYINSSLDAAEIRQRQAAVARGRVKLVYVAPERLMLPGFLRLLAAAEPSFFAIDEAHCISEWGHDFRPEYRELSRLRELFPSSIVGAFTATATRRVRADIVTQLGLQAAATFQGSFNRPNLYYEVRPKESAYEQLVAYLRTRPQASGIIYCQSRAGVERLAADLQADGFSALAYHAGLESQERRRRQEAFRRDDVLIIVATIAFGMGIDKPDVRFVVHYDLPKNLEGYYQESGRAGRDGEPSDCLLFYSYGDKVKHEYFIRQKPTEAERRVAARQLRYMVDWAEGATCRRQTLLAYFDEQLDARPGRCCDVCCAPARMEDYTVAAQMFLSCVKRTGERYGATHVIGVLRGSRSERVRAAGHDRLPTYGIGRQHSGTEWRHLARELVRAGYLRVAPAEFNALKVTERGRAVLFEGERVMLAAPRHEVAQVGPVASPGQEELFERLRQLRKRLADERGVPPYVIFHDTVLRQMAASRPTELAQLRRVAGVGERKLLDFGEDFLQAIADYVRDHPEPPATRPATARARPRAGLGPTIRATLQLFREGRSPAEIAAARSLALSTIEGHLAQALEAGERLEVDRLIGLEKRRAIEAVLRELGTERLAPAKERLGEGYSYAELRIVRAVLGLNAAAGMGGGGVA